jgi:hypothetical protein
MPGPFDPTPRKSPAQLQREADAARRLEQQRQKDCEREQEKMEDTPGQMDRQPGTGKR